ncbi:hypothetical protein L218DRAFT_950991 [Marasmius fiardii PR-910]|nr:hypothetical protein L218DRAFT_950991 [Marasmius fiardii PR-910]
MYNMFPKFNTIFLDSFPRSSDWVVITGTLMGQTSFSMIVTRLEEFYLHMNPEAATITPVPNTTYAALMAKIDSLEKAMATLLISVGNRVVEKKASFRQTSTANISSIQALIW